MVIRFLILGDNIEIIMRQSMLINGIAVGVALYASLYVWMVWKLYLLSIKLFNFHWLPTKLIDVIDYDIFQKNKKSIL